MANAALGGDTCHRGSLLGAIFGCAGANVAVIGSGSADAAKLRDSDALQTEIAAFVALVTDRRTKYAQEQEQEQVANKARPSSFVLRFPPTASAASGPEVEACAT